MLKSFSMPVKKIPLPEYFPTASEERFPLLTLPDEHYLRFSKYKTAQELWGAILKTFGGNEATKKTKKNQLKQQYGNFKAEGSETLEQTFNRLQAIVSHLEFMDIEIEQDDLNQKFLTSLAPEWLISGKGEVNTASIPTASTHVSPASADVTAVSISLDTVCAYIASQSNGSHIKYEDINQIDKGDIKEMNIKWNMALEAGVKFFMFSRFVQVFVNHQLGDMSHHKKILVTPSLTNKVFANMKREGKSFSGIITPLFETMMVQALEKVGEGKVDTAAEVTEEITLSS
nr:hypothetical protein [Tanacetum cinerariifolium]